MRHFLLFLALAALVRSQTRTRTVAGQTVVELVTVTQNAVGVPVTTTQTLRTLVNDPIAGNPPDLDTDNPNPTVYWVTSYDEDGNAIVDSRIFAPTFAPSSAPVDYTQGSILNYDQWTSKYATQTFAPSNAQLRAGIDFRLLSYATLCAFLVVYF